MAIASLCSCSRNWISDSVILRVGPSGYMRTRVIMLISWCPTLIRASGRSPGIRKSTPSWMSAARTAEVTRNSLSCSVLRAHALLMSSQPADSAWVCCPPPVSFFMGELLKKWGETWAQTCQVVQSPCKPALVARGLVPPARCGAALAGRQASLRRRSGRPGYRARGPPILRSLRRSTSRDW